MKRLLPRWTTVSATTIDCAFSHVSHCAAAPHYSRFLAFRAQITLACSGRAAPATSDDVPPSAARKAARVKPEAPKTYASVAAVQPRAPEPVRIAPAVRLRAMYWRAFCEAAPAICFPLCSPLRTYFSASCPTNAVGSRGGPRPSGEAHGSSCPCGKTDGPARSTARSCEARRRTGGSCSRCLR